MEGDGYFYFDEPQHRPVADERRGATHRREFVQAVGLSILERAVTSDPP
jgi:hypothetical protein